MGGAFILFIAVTCAEFPKIRYNLRLLILTGVIVNYTLIKGSFHVVGQSPDGDSLKFRAANAMLWDKVQTENRDMFIKNFKEDAGVVQLRLEGIDALETHYTPPKPPNSNYKPKGFSQPEDFGRLSTNAFLDFLGVKDVKWRTFGRNTYISQATINGTFVKTKLTDNIAGYIVTGDMELNGRPVSWVFVGDTDLDDGSTISKEKLAKLVPKSANYHLLRTGMVYPLFFSTLPAVARSVLAEAVKEALVNAAKNPSLPSIWLIDYSVRGLEITSIKMLVESHSIYPYIFRKIIKHYTNLEAVREASGQPSSETVPLEGFYKEGNPTIFVVSEQDFLRLDEILEISGSTIRMKKAPHDLVFLA